MVGSTHAGEEDNTFSNGMHVGELAHNVPSKCNTRWLDVVSVSKAPSSAEGDRPRMCKSVRSAKADGPVNSTCIERRGTTPAKRTGTKANRQGNKTVTCD